MLTGLHHPAVVVLLYHHFASCKAESRFRPVQDADIGPSFEKILCHSKYRMETSFREWALLKELAITPNQKRRLLQQFYRNPDSVEYVKQRFADNPEAVAVIEKLADMVKGRLMYKDAQGQNVDPHGVPVGGSSFDPSGQVPRWLGTPGKKMPNSMVGRDDALIGKMREWLSKHSKS